MRVDTKDINPAFLDIIRNPAQRIFLDANFFVFCVSNSAGFGNSSEYIFSSKYPQPAYFEIPI